MMFLGSTAWAYSKRPSKYTRGLANYGQSCYMNSVIQSVKCVAEHFKLFSKKSAESQNSMELFNRCQVKQDNFTQTLEDLCLVLRSTSANISHVVNPSAMKCLLPK
ncbi:uncharacterized protein LOC141913388 [Tubulanus polymorphus]|uniref:uncharacterized protein LOC141898118 n=1 Tax=Tubulanus polymorphus TaxID=672921 RepID=UPI003DA26F88